MLLKRRLSPTTTFRIGSACLALSLITGYFAPRVHLASENWIAAVQGLLLGVSIGLLLLALRRKGGGSKS